MDINGLVNHPKLETKLDTRGLRSLSPQSSDSARSQIHSDSLPHYHPSYGTPHHENETIPYRKGDEGYSPRFQFQGHSDRANTSPIKRQLPTSPYPAPPSKKRPPEVTGENGKHFPARRRALQACEACRTKKSKCDNERPSCGSCVQHGIECVYKGAPFVPVYVFSRDC